MPRYMVHKHEATKAGLHWDLRLEQNGVLKSWAIPKGMPRKSGVRHLAIQTPDHDLSYGKWEGTIPEGSYGAGKVTIDATGEYQTIEQTKKKWKFQCLTGKYKGTWTLIHWKNKQWLITKSADLKQTLSYSAEEAKVGQKGEVAWRSMNPLEYALGLELGHLPLERALGEGHYAMLGGTPADFQVWWKGYPLFEIDLEGLSYVKSVNVQWDQPHHTNIAITQDIPIDKVTPYDSDLGITEVRGKYKKLKHETRTPHLVRGDDWPQRFNAEDDKQVELAVKRTQLSVIRTGLAITTFGIVLWNLWMNKKQERQIESIMDLV